MNMKTIDFKDAEGNRLSLEEAVMQALGRASACWEKLDHAGIFESDKCKAVGDALLEFIYEEQTSSPLLGLATTEELLKELISRMETDRFVEGATNEEIFNSGFGARVLKKFLGGELGLSERQLTYRTVDSV
jgi:hypothetical protein